MSIVDDDDNPTDTPIVGEVKSARLNSVGEVVVELVVTDKKIGKMLTERLI